MADDTPEMATWWQIRQRVVFTEARTKALDAMVAGLSKAELANRARAEAAHRRLDEIEDTGALVKDVLERLDKLEATVAKISEWLKTRPWKAKEE
jgi:hypothetical protein